MTLPSLASPEKAGLPANFSAPLANSTVADSVFVAGMTLPSVANPTAFRQASPFQDSVPTYPTVVASPLLTSKVPTQNSPNSFQQNRQSIAEASLPPSLKKLEELFSSSLCGAVSGLSQGQLANSAKILSLDKKLDRIIALSSKDSSCDDLAVNPNTKWTQTDPVVFQQAEKMALDLLPVTIPAISKIINGMSNRLVSEISKLNASLSKVVASSDKIPHHFVTHSDDHPLPSSPRPSSGSKSKQKRWYGKGNSNKTQSDATSK